MLNAYLSATLGLCSPLPHDKNQTGQDFYDYLLSVKHQQCPDSVQDTTAGLTKRKKKKSTVAKIIYPLKSSRMCSQEALRHCPS